jgi:hypothetical protein
MAAVGTASFQMFTSGFQNVPNVSSLLETPPAGGGRAASPAANDHFCEFIAPFFRFDLDPKERFIRRLDSGVFPCAVAAYRGRNPRHSG